MNPPRLVPTLSLCALLTLAAAGGVGARTTKTLHVRGGSATLTLDSGTAAAMRVAGFSISATSPGSGSSSLRYPVTGGSVSTSFAGSINAAGGMRIRGNGRQANLSNFVVATNGRSGTLTASGAGSGRFVLLNLSIGAVHRSGRNLGASGSARLSAAGARALNRALRTRIFSAGLLIGQAHLVART